MDGESACTTRRPDRVSRGVLGRVGGALGLLWVGLGVLWVGLGPV